MQKIPHTAVRRLSRLPVPQTWPNLLLANPKVDFPAWFNSWPFRATMSPFAPRKSRYFRGAKDDFGPFKPQDFQDDKLSVLDIKAVDRTGVVYDVEMQLTTYEGLVQRIVYYGCRALRRPAQGGREAQDPPSGLYDLAGQWHPLAGRDPGPPCLSPGRRRSGAGLGGDLGDSHAGTGEV